MLNKIYYINLSHRLDRKEHIECLLEKASLIDLTNRVDAIKNDEGAIGCILSHIKTLELFLENNVEYCLVLEDDFISDTPELIKSSIDKIFSDNIEFDIIQLSGNYIKLEDCNYSYLKKVIDSQTSSSYLVSRKFATILLNNFKQSLELISTFGRQHEYCLDIYWKRLQPISNWYCFYPPLGYQMDGYSDIEKSNVSYKC